MKNKYRLSLLIVLIGSVLTLFGAGEYGHPYYEEIQGSYNHLITTLHRHSNGLMWVGTSTGLCRFDGYNVVPAPNVMPDSARITTDYIQKICEDSQGRLWLMTQGECGIYDPARCIEINNVDSILNRAGIPLGYINDIQGDKDGSIWIAMQDDGIYKLDTTTGEARKTDYKVNDDFNVSCIVFNKFGLAVCVDESGRLSWIDPQTLQVIEEVLPWHDMSVKRKENYQLAVDNDNHYWIYTTHVIEVYDGNLEKWVSDKIPPKDKQGTIKQIYQDRQGSLMLARDNKGVEKIVKSGDQFHFVTVDNPQDITYRNTITYFLDDQRGSKWIGTYKKGLLDYNESVKKFMLAEIPDVNCILAGSGNTVWVGTDSSGLWRWNTATGQKERVIDPSEDDTPAAITSLVSTPDGTLYIGSFAFGLRRVRNGRIESVKTGSGLDTSFAWSLTPDGQGGFWVATLGSGVFHYNPASGETRHYSDTTTYTPELYATSGIRSKDGCYYFGHSAGISYIDPAEKKVHSIKEINEDFDTKDGRIVQLFEDSRGLLWAATSRGLKVIDRTHGKMSSVPTGGDKTSSYISGIVEDNGGSIWVSEGRNLINIRVIYDEKSGSISFSHNDYDSEDGLMKSDFNQRSFAKLPTGEILVGGLYGINRFIPSDIKYNSAIPNVVFTDLYVNGAQVLPGDKSHGVTILDKSLYNGGSVTLPHATRDFTVFFTTDNYALPQKTRYEYRLEGYDNQWHALPAGTHAVTYTNLSGGDYSLLVKAINSDGYESDTDAPLHITVKPPIWTTWWAYIIYAILGALFMWGVFVVIRGIEKRHFKRKVKEEERKKQDEINQLKFQFFTNVSHDLRTPLTLIISPLDEMIKETEDEKQKKRLKLLKDNATRLLTLVNQLLDFRKNEVTGLRFNPVESDIVAFTKKVCNSFLTLSEKRKVKLSFYADHSVTMMAFDPDKLEKILMNLLGNAFKFTPPYGRVDVSLEEVGSQKPVLSIKVADTGSGIRDEDKDHVFETFYQSDDEMANNANTGSGIGLSMVKEYVKLHQGTVRVTDNVPCGSIFIVDIPITHTDHKAPAEESMHIMTPSLMDADVMLEKQDEDSIDSMPDGGGKRPVLLVVDDNRDMTEMLNFEFENEFEVVTALDGREALEMVAKSTPDIILTDLMMPGMDGIELCRRLKADPKTVSIPLVILTAKHDLGVKIEGLTLGADDYITKPFNLEVLRLRLKRLIALNRKGATRALIEPEPESIKITPLDEKLIEKAMKYVSDNLDSPKLSVEELSDYLGMSRVRLYKKIKQITGKTPIEFIRVIRLKRAAQLLRESQLNVSEIAYRTGFNSPKMFSKYFKEEFGILPSVYQDKEGTETNVTV